MRFSDLSSELELFSVKSYDTSRIRDIILAIAIQLNNLYPALRFVIIVVAWNSSRMRRLDLNSKLHESFSVESRLQIQCHVY